MRDLKIIISGLDNAGKTSILKAFDKRYDFEKDVLELLPTRKVEYHRAKFLKISVSFWDMGGQKRYRKVYSTNPDLYFSETDLLIYIIDIQDNGRFKKSLEYLDQIMDYFEKHKMQVPLIVAFHKLDPELKDNAKIIKNVDTLTDHIFNIKQLKKIFVQTSIYDIISIVQLLSSALSVFDDKYTELNNLFEKYLKDFNCESLILFDKNGIIVSEFFKSSLEFDTYLLLIKSIEEHIVKLKKIQENKSDLDSDFHSIEKDIVSYLHLIKFKDETFYMSVIINQKSKEEMKNRIPGFLSDLNNILEPLLS